MIYNQAFYLTFAFLAVLFTARQSKPRFLHLGLAVANLAFLVVLFYWREKSLLILFAILLGNFLTLKLVERLGAGSLKAGLASGLIGGNLALLVFFFYPSLLAHTSFARFSPVPLVGISWGVLRLLHLAIEIRGGALRHRLSFFRFFNFILFFPAYLSGPLARYDDFIETLEHRPPLTAERAYDACKRIVLGLFQTNVLAFTLNYFSLQALDDTLFAGLSPGKQAAAVIAFGLWIYFSFAGATDIAIGLGQLLGVALPENFNRPFLATNLQEFWQRWHISLLAWIRDYLFRPLQLFFFSLIPVPFLATGLSILVGFALLGLWHGDSLHFLFYGLYHGVGMALYFAYARGLRRRVPASAKPPWLGALATAAAWVLTWSYISGGWFFYLGRERLLYTLLFGGSRFHT